MPNLESLDPISKQAGKFLTFQLGVECYAVEILKVQEIIGLLNITRVPKTPDFIRGVINLRGQVIPIVDLRLKFGFSKVEPTEKTCIVVVQIITEQDRKTTMGILVDHVSEVMYISEEQMGATPEFGFEVNTDYLLGLAKINEKVIMLLNIDKVIKASDVLQMNKSDSKNNEWDS